jgi:Nif-specific regulatory protein
VILPLGLSLEEVERRYAEATLAAMKGNRTKAAQSLGVGRNTLKRKADRPR